MLQGHGDDTYDHPGIRSNFSSNIFPHADLTGLKAHLQGKLDLIERYPEPEPHSLEEVIARKHGISSDNVLVTNGATDAIYLISQTAAKNHHTHFNVGPLPTFREYEDACRMFGLAQVNGCDGFKKAVHTILWLCNPNNPTGDVYPKAELEDYAQRYGLVVIDQSYEDYTLEPVMSHQEAAASRNIVQLHSLTKTYAVPGLRIGYVIAPQPIITRLRENVRPWAVNALAIEAGIWLVENDICVLQDPKDLKDLKDPKDPKDPKAPTLPQSHSGLRALLAETRRLREMLNQIPGITAAETQTNFFLVEMASKTAAELKDHLAQKHHILIRDASNFRGLTPRHFRISTQYPDENTCLADAIREFIFL